MPEMRKLTFNELEVEIVKEIRKWRDQMISDDGGESTISEIDAGDASSLASEIATEIIGFGIDIIGEWKANRKLNDGWD